MTSIIAYGNNAFQDGTPVLDTGTEFAGSLSYISRIQPSLYLQATPSGGEVQVAFLGSGGVEDWDVVALLGHNLDDGDTVNFYQGTSTLVASHTISNVPHRPNNAIEVLTSPVSNNNFRVEILTSVSPVQIGAIWYSPSFRPTLGFESPSYATTPDTLTQWDRVNSTIWPSSRDVVSRLSVTLPGLSREEAYGPSMPNWRGIAHYSGRDKPLIIIPDDQDIHMATYGLVEMYGSIRPESEPKAKSWRANFDLLEMQ